MTEDIDLNEFAGGAFFKGRDFADGPEYHTIVDVFVAEFRDGTRKPALTFSDADKQAALGPLNVKSLKTEFGDKTSGWIGRTVMLMAGPEFNGNPSLLVLPQKPLKSDTGAPPPGERPRTTRNTDIPF